MAAWLEHAACQLQAVEQIFLAVKVKLPDHTYNKNDSLGKMNNIAHELKIETFIFIYFLSWKFRILNNKDEMRYNIGKKIIWFSVIHAPLSGFFCMCLSNIYGSEFFFLPNFTEAYIDKILLGSASNQMLPKSTRYSTKHLLIHFNARHSTNEFHLSFFLCFDPPSASPLSLSLYTPFAYISSSIALLVSSNLIIFDTDLTKSPSSTLGWLYDILVGLVYSWYYIKPIKALGCDAILFGSKLLACHPIVWSSIPVALEAPNIFTLQGRNKQAHTPEKLIPEEKYKGGDKPLQNQIVDIQSFLEDGKFYFKYCCVLVEIFLHYTNSYVAFPQLTGSLASIFLNRVGIEHTYSNFILAQCQQGCLKFFFFFFFFFFFSSAPLANHKLTWLPIATLLLIKSNIPLLTFTSLCLPPPPSHLLPTSHCYPPPVSTNRLTQATQRPVLPSTCPLPPANKPTLPYNIESATLYHPTPASDPATLPSTCLCLNEQPALPSTFPPLPTNRPVLPYN
ncbi:hypothetical protein VP01_1355g2 [Puccinia sorghi]|uniref:Uncharacterized protein n=1 Tax=Puccinia sorghi TaxID=27349 RepID=A0A0L6VMI8_9BASI|nr:hypothetical protein VP01_1355g2 [Puccinia sorghi]